MVIFLTAWGSRTSLTFFVFFTFFYQPTLNETVEITFFFASRSNVFRFENLILEEASFLQLHHTFWPFLISLGSALLNLAQLHEWIVEIMGDIM